MLAAFFFWEVEDGWSQAAGTAGGFESVWAVAADEEAEIADSGTALGTGGQVGAAHGLHRTARALKLDYYALKERVEGANGQRKENRAKGSTFIELLPQAVASGKECLIEVEEGSGRLRVHLKN